MAQKRKGASLSGPRSRTIDAPAPQDTTEGWKDDPTQPGKKRWWTGTEWTDRIGQARMVAAFPGTDTGNLPLKSEADRKTALAQRLQYLVNVIQSMTSEQANHQLA